MADNSKQLNGYALSRSWFDFCFLHPEKIKPNHTAVYFFAIEHCNRLGWKRKFGFPTTMAMEALGIKSYNTYINALNDLVDFGFIEMIQKSKNQYSANIIALSKFDKALDKALDKAFIKHVTKQSESTVQSTGESIDSIYKQVTTNHEQSNNLATTQNEFALDSDVPVKEKTIIQETVEYLNKKTSKNFRHTTAGTIKLIKARLNDNYTIDDFKKVIDVKVANWTGTEYEQYLQPATLFGNKFDNYLNEDIKEKESDIDFINSSANPFASHGIN